MLALVCGPALLAIEDLVQNNHVKRDLKKCAVRQKERKFGHVSLIK